MTTTLTITEQRYIGYPLKRLIDVIVSASSLLLLSPFMVIIALAIRITSRGPVLYRQRRLGLNEGPFCILKFRSMRVDADRTGPRVTADNDARITPVGRFLRRTSLDELPQLVNVLCGDMSLFGPRPYVGFELDNWTHEARAARASLRPGISGMAQVFGRSCLTEETCRTFDLDYVRRCSLSLDCEILARTILVVAVSRGTN